FDFRVVLRLRARDRGVTRAHRGNLCGYIRPPLECVAHEQFDIVAQSLRKMVRFAARDFDGRVSGNSHDEAQIRFRVVEHGVGVLEIVERLRLYLLRQEHLRPRRESYTVALLYGVDTRAGQLEVGLGCADARARRRENVIGLFDLEYDVLYGA